MKKILNFNTIIIFFIFLFILNLFITQGLIAQSDPSLEEQITNSLNEAGIEAGYGEAYEETPTSIAITIGYILQIVLSFLGVIFLVIIIYSGFQWMTAGGNEETVAKAKKRLTNATIGLVIIFSALLISYFIINELMYATDYQRST